MTVARSAADRSPAAWQRVSVGVLGMVTALVLAACGGPTPVSLTQLVLDAEGHDGTVIVVRGVVRAFGGPDDGIERYFVIQDADDNRVRLLPDDAARPHVGSAVEVTGEFGFDDRSGRELTVEHIESLHR